MCERQVHPAIFVKVERHHAHCRRQLLLSKINPFERAEFPFAWIQQNGRTRRSAGQNKINRAIVVEICRNHACPRGSYAQSRLRRNIRERAVAIVPPQKIMRAPGA